MPKAVYKSEKVEAWWDVPVYADHQEVRANRVDARIVNHVSKKVMTIEMSCPWISNREKKSEEKTMKYGPLMWEVKEHLKDTMCTMAFNVRQNSTFEFCLYFWHSML